jgi:hypothetical protein
MSQSTSILRFEKAIPSSACTAVVQTDAGKGYLKGLGGPEGPHTLACEWIATQLAQWSGLPTLDIAIIEVSQVDEIPFLDQKGERIGQAQPGRAFISRGEAGEPWSGNENQLKRLANPEDISRLVVFDTWTRNCDRHSWPEGEAMGRPRINLNNVFLSEEAPPGQFILKAIDHTHCFTCGRALTTKLATIDIIRDGRVFGLFPQFRSYMDPECVTQAAADLRRIDRSWVRSLTQSLPNEWEVARDVQDALERLILDRAGYVADKILRMLWPQREFGFAEPEGETGVP